MLEYTKNSERKGGVLARVTMLQKTKKDENIIFSPK